MSEPKYPRAWGVFQHGEKLRVAFVDRRRAESAAKHARSLNTTIIELIPLPEHEAIVAAAVAAERDAWKDTYRRGFDAAKAAAKHVIDFAKVAAGVEEKMSGDNKCSLLVLAIEKEINELEPEVAQ